MPVLKQNAVSEHYAVIAGQLQDAPNFLQKSSRRNLKLKCKAASTSWVASFLGGPHLGRLVGSMQTG